MSTKLGILVTNKQGVFNEDLFKMIFNRYKDILGLGIDDKAGLNRLESAMMSKERYMPQPDHALYNRVNNALSALKMNDPDVVAEAARLREYYPELNAPAPVPASRDTPAVVVEVGPSQELADLATTRMKERRESKKAKPKVDTKPETKADKFKTAEVEKRIEQFKKEGQSFVPVDQQALEQRRADFIRGKLEEEQMVNTVEPTSAMPDPVQQSLEELENPKGVLGMADPMTELAILGGLAALSGGFAGRATAPKEEEEDQSPIVLR